MHLKDSECKYLLGPHLSVHITQYLVLSNQRTAKNKPIYFFNHWCFAFTALYMQRVHKFLALWLCLHYIPHISGHFCTWIVWILCLFSHLILDSFFSHCIALRGLHLNSCISLMYRWFVDIYSSLFTKMVEKK